MKRNYKVTVKALQKDENGNLVEIEIPSYATEECTLGQWLKGLKTDKPVTINEDGSKKEDHTLRNVLLAGGLLVAGGYAVHEVMKANQTTPVQPVNYQEQQTYQIPMQQPQQVCTPQPQMIPVPTGENQYTMMETAAPCEIVNETQHEVTDGVTVTEF